MDRCFLLTASWSPWMNVRVGRPDGRRRLVDGVSSIQRVFARLKRESDGNRKHIVRLLGESAPFYRSHLCENGWQISIGTLEPQFHTKLIARIGAPAARNKSQYDRGTWPSRCVILVKLFASKSRDECCTQLKGSDSSSAPVLELDEAAQHPYMVACQTYVEIAGMAHALRARRFSRTPGLLHDTRDPADLIASWDEADRLASPRASAS